MLQYCFYSVLVFQLGGMWDLSSMTRDRTHTPCIGRQSLNHWTAREVLWRRSCTLSLSSGSISSKDIFFSSWYSLSNYYWYSAFQAPHSRFHTSDLHLLVSHTPGPADEPLPASLVRQQARWGGVGESGSGGANRGFQNTLDAPSSWNALPWVLPIHSTFLRLESSLKWLPRTLSWPLYLEDVHAIGSKRASDSNALFPITLHCFFFLKTTYIYPILTY